MKSSNRSDTKTYGWCLINDHVYVKRHRTDVDAMSFSHISVSITLYARCDQFNEL